MDEAGELADSEVSPKQIALTYDRVISAHWRGETDTATVLDAWFEAHWSDQAPPEPDAPPEGTSVLGGSGAGIRWYARDEVVLGYVSRRPNGCYRVPMREAVPALKDSWDILELEAVRQLETDLLVSDGERSAVQDRKIPDVRLAVQLFEPTATENPSGVVVGS
jgi:hypothetical protein